MKRAEWEMENQGDNEGACWVQKCRDGRWRKAITTPNQNGGTHPFVAESTRYEYITPAGAAVLLWTVAPNLDGTGLEEYDVTNIEGDDCVLKAVISLDRALDD